nr:MAG: chaperone of endosialidase [Bacteriophage sp.]
METVALLYEDYQKELAEDFKNTFLKRASDTDSSRSNDTVIDEVTDMLSTNIAVYTEKLLQRWGFSSGGEGGGGGDVTVTLDDLLKKYLSDNYVTIKGDQEVFGEKDFRKGIRIAGRRLYWDEGNDALVIEGAAYTTRWLSAKGVSPGGGGAGSGGAAAMYQLIDVSPNDTKDAVLGAEKDYVLTFDGSFWRGMPNKGGLSSKLFTALDKEGHEINPDDENAEVYAIRANYSLWSVGFLSAKGISDGGTGGGGGGAVALYQLLDVEKNADITGVAGATKGSVLTFNGDKWYADKPKTAAGISNLFTALDNDGNEVDLNDESKLGTITNIRANYALWSVDWISAKGKSSGGSGGGGGLINLVYGFESLGGTFDNNDNSATFNAFTINEIWKLASSGLTNVTVTGSGNAVTDVIKGSDGRSLTFTKGSTFATKSEFDALNTKFNDFLTGSDADDIINKWSELEVFLQGMKESDNLAVILQSKMDKTAFSKLFTALDASGNEVDPSDDTKTIASIRANFGFWGVDYISAKGVSKGSGGTGGASTLYQLVDVLANDTEDGVEGAAAGKALVFDGTHWRAGDAGLNESQLYSYLTANKYLTQSAADSRYVTSSRKVIAGTGLSGGGALTSDVTLSLGTSGVVAGTYTKVMVDAYGRVTSGTNLSATDIPNLDWSKITTGKPTTLAGYGITDAVTLTTAQTISGRKTFSQNIVFNNNGGITYIDSNVVLRNSDGHTILASFGNGEINLRPNGHNNTEGAVWINKTGNVQAPSVSTNTITIGDAQLVYDSKNKALRVKHRTDGNTVGFYSDGWVSALGVKTGGSGVVTTVYSFANLTDGTTFSDSDLDNTFNAYTIKKLYDMAGQGGLDADAMWAELKKADSSKVIDASHIPTSVLDGRWVKKAGDTMTGTLTSASSSGSIVFKGVENCDITNIYKDNGVIKNDDGGLTSIRNGLRFNWYDTYWYIGNIRGSSTDSAGFGVVDHNNKLVLRVTPNDVRAPRFMSTVATGVSPLIVSSNTLVNNLNADLLDGYHQSSFLRADGVNQYVTLSGGDGNNEGYRLVFEGTVTGGWSINSMTLLVNSRHAGTGMISIVFHTTNQESTSYIGSLNYYGSTISLGDTMWRLFYNTTTKKVRLFWRFYAYSDCQVSILNRRGITTNISNKTWYTTIPSDSGSELPAYYNWASSAHALATSRTLWGQPFNGTANVSGDMTGVGSITMSGDLKIGNGTSPNTIYFYGTTGDSPGGYNHTFIAERFWGGTESSELVLFKGNDVGNGNEAVNVSYTGPDRIRHIAAAHLFQTYTSALSGSVEDVCTSSALKSLFGIAANRVTSYVPFMSTVASGVAPFIVVSNTVVGNLNADLLDGLHAERFLLSVGRSDGTFDLNTYSERAIKEIRTTEQTTNNAPFAGYGLLANLWDSNKFAALQIGGTSTDLFFRGKHDGTNKITSAWHRLLHTENYASIADGRYVKKAGDTMTGDLNISGGHILYMLQTSSTSTQQIHFQGGRDDYGRIAFGGTAENAGWMEIASCDDGNEPIYARQYTGVFTTVKNTLTLLDANGDTVMSSNKGLSVGWGSRQVREGGSWVHGGADAANSDDANLRFGSWMGIGWYPTISGQTVAQGKNAMWLNVRNGNLDTHGAITAHTNYLAANWDSARRLVLGGGSSYVYIDSRNSSNNVLCNIMLKDNKVFIGNYAESSRFVSTVGTGTAPYQCSSTTLNTNLNADLLDNWHIMDIPRNYNSTATYSLQFALGGTDNNWKKIFACSESGAGPYRSVTVWGRIWYAYGNHAQDEVRSYHFCAIFQMRSDPSASDSNVGNISNSARLYLPTFAKGMDNIRLVRVGTNNFELQVRQIGSYHNGHIQYQYWANGANVSAWRVLQSTSNTSVAVSAGGASTLADSRASSADVWTTARTFYIQDYHSANTGAGVSVNGGSNCYLKLPSTTRFSRIDFSTPNANIRHSGNDNGNEVGSSTLSNLVIDSWYGVSFTTTSSSTYQNKIAMSVNCRTGRVTANNFHAATNITANGAITAKASSSDIRLKTDIQGYDAMGIIRKFQSVKYHWNAIAKENSEVFNHDNWNYGLIAQDLLSGGYSQWVKDAFNDYYTIDYERLIPVVWKGLQEVDDEVTKLKREVARLNKRVKELEKSLCA